MWGCVLDHESQGVGVCIRVIGSRMWGCGLDYGSRVWESGLDYRGRVWGSGLDHGQQGVGVWTRSWRSGCGSLD